VANDRCVQATFQDVFHAYALSASFRTGLKAFYNQVGFHRMSLIACVGRPAAWRPSAWRPVALASSGPL